MLVMVIGMLIGMSLDWQAEPVDRHTEVAIIVGPDHHPSGTHEALSTGRLIQFLLENNRSDLRIRATVLQSWPSGGSVLERAATLVFLGDLFPPTQMPDRERIMREVSQLMDRGVGIVCVHYATGIHADDVPPKGEHPLLGWLGGYFANPGTPGHSSVARLFPEARIQPWGSMHPIERGWDAFVIDDEPYYQNFFGAAGIGEGVTLLAYSMLPPESPQKEAVAWCVERKDTGRGFGVVMPHFFRNWSHADLRKLILNGIVWTARLEVPAGGVETDSPRLEDFQGGE